jgi:hypothetical protein
MNPASGPDVTVRDVLNGLEAMEKWTRQLREALEVRTAAAPQQARVRGESCPPPSGTKKPKKRGGTKKK